MLPPIHLDLMAHNCRSIRVCSSSFNFFFMARLGPILKNLTDFFFYGKVDEQYHKTNFSVKKEKFKLLLYGEAVQEKVVT